MPIPTASQVEQIRRAINPQRLVDTALALIEVPSPTRSAGAVADRLAEILIRDGFQVERPVANWPEAPAVVVRFSGEQPGRILQFDGHLDTVHLPFVPARVEGDNLYGSGSSDMKGGIAAFVEALRVLRETHSLTGGDILLTAHDHHEGPWGDRRQLRGLLAEGYRGDAVLLPEYLADRLPVAGRGLAIFDITIRREGVPVHEVLRPPQTPDVIATGAELLMRLRSLHSRLSSRTAPYAGSDSVFVGKFLSGEIFNQSPVECLISGTRRWVTPGDTQNAISDIRNILAAVAQESSTQIEASFDIAGDAFRLDPHGPIATAFQSAYQAVTGAPLPLGDKPFVDDGNIFSTEFGVPAITHGPAATGAHTLNECVPIPELVRVAQVYALTAIAFCPSDSSN